jgi:hypothetical protein|tara:strand:- start:10 stop:384 length:375 start_codon:yes stop_codon:yes gene_type:complete
MKLTEAQENDIRGFRWLFENDNNVITLFEVKKGFARGGQYHKKEVKHILLSGKSEYRKMNINTKIETREIVSGMKIITLPPFTSELIIGIEYSVFVGIYPKEEEFLFFNEHRKEVEKRIKFNMK